MSESRQYIRKLEMEIHRLRTINREQAQTIRKISGAAEHTMIDTLVSVIIEKNRTIWELERRLLYTDVDATP